MQGRVVNSLRKNESSAARVCCFPAWNDAVGKLLELAHTQLHEMVYA